MGGCDSTCVIFKKQAKLIYGMKSWGYWLYFWFSFLGGELGQVGEGF